MKTHNYRVPGKRILDPGHSQGDFAKSLNGNFEAYESRGLHDLTLPDNKLIEVWYEDTIAPITLNEYKNISSMHTSKRSNCCQGNTFETKPFSEIYNMAVIRDSF
jgi:hypothetical protein